MVYGEYIQKPAVELTQLLANHLPKNLEKTYLANSGTEAVEGAIKLAKRATGRSQIIAAKNAYHGSTIGAMSVMGFEDRKRAFRPLLPDVYFIPFNDLNELNKITPKTACVILETIQGGAGFIEPINGYLQKVQERCKAVGALFILDEIQTGIGRTGKLFGFENYNCSPDILISGKGLGGGMPIGAFTTSGELMDLLQDHPKLGHITTFGGHPLPCASSAAALSLLKKIDFPAMEERAGNFQSRMMAHALVQDVRRIGAYIAVELKDAASVAFCVDHALKSGLLIYYFLSTPNAFRVAPPLTMDSDTWLKATELMCQTLDACASIEPT